MNANGRDFFETYCSENSVDFEFSSCVVLQGCYCMCCSRSVKFDVDDFSIKMSINVADFFFLRISLLKLLVRSN